MSQKRATKNVIDEAAEAAGISGDVTQKFQDGLKAVQDYAGEIDETTIPDAFANMPKMISPNVHRWLDIGVTAYFVGVGAWCASRGKMGAAIAAFVNAGMVAGVSAFTDYEGTGEKPINFKMHGTLDAAQAMTAAAAPMLHGFADEPEAMFFYGQALNEVGVIAMTDWDAGMRRKKRARRAA